MASNYHLYTMTCTTEEGFIVILENCVQIGNSSLWGSLLNHGYIYDTYGVSVGLQEDSGWQIGATDDLQFEYTRSMAQLEIGNVRESGIWELESEECKLTMNMYEWKPNVIGRVFNVTVTSISDTDKFITFGGGCTLNSRPCVVQGTNVSCNASSITDLTDGVEFMVLTLYDVFSSEGATLPFTARENSPIPVTLEARPVLELTAGYRFGSLYMATD